MRFIGTVKLGTFCVNEIYRVLLVVTHVFGSNMHVERLPISIVKHLIPPFFQIFIIVYFANGLIEIFLLTFTPYSLYPLMMLYILCHENWHV